MKTEFDIQDLAIIIISLEDYQDLRKGLSPSTYESIKRVIDKSKEMTKEEYPT